MFRLWFLPPSALETEITFSWRFNWTFIHIFIYKKTSDNTVLTTVADSWIYTGKKKKKACNESQGKPGPLTLQYSEQYSAITIYLLQDKW